MNYESKPFRMWKGVIESNKDPEERGRVRVRIYGVNTSDTEAEPSDKLYWAEVIMPGIFGGVGGYGISSVMIQGSTVWGFFADGDESQPVVIGYSTAKIGESGDFGVAFTDPDKKFGGFTQGKTSEPKKDFHDKKGEQGILSNDPDGFKENERQDKMRITGIPTAQNKAGTLNSNDSNNNSAQYPFFHTIQTPAGHFIKFDDTPGNERIYIMHKSGAKVHIDHEGNIEIQAVKDTNQLSNTGSHNVYANQNMNIATGVDYTLGTGGDVIISTTNINSISSATNFIKSAGDTTIIGKPINLNP